MPDRFPPLTDDETAASLIERLDRIAEVPPTAIDADVAVRIALTNQVRDYATFYRFDEVVTRCREVRESLDREMARREP